MQTQTGTERNLMEVTMIGCKGARGRGLARSHVCLNINCVRWARLFCQRRWLSLLLTLVCIVEHEFEGVTGDNSRTIGAIAIVESAEAL